MLSTYYLIESADKSKLCFRHWRANNPKLCICLLHGLGEHSARYEKWSSLFTARGISVCAIDLRGHGLSEGKRGHAGSFKKIFNDVDRFFTESNAHYPDTPKILYGQGLGENIAVSYFLSHKPIIAGLIITSPWFKLAYNFKAINLIISQSLRYIFPLYTFSSQINPKHISRSNNIVAEYSTDKLVHDRMSVKLYFDAKQYGFRASGRGYQINLPLLLMHGTADNITSYKTSVNFSRNTGIFTTFKSWEGACHELHHEPNNTEVFEYIMDWINMNFNK